MMAAIFSSSEQSVTAIADIYDAVKKEFVKRGCHVLNKTELDQVRGIILTEAGTVNTGIIKSAVGIGALLAEGIGDTFRISLTGDPVNEVKVANEILKALGLKEYGPTLISCPTCGRCNIDLPSIAEKVEQR